jgi:predicted phage baseplate assembly protein
MALPAPDLDDRRFQDLVDDAKRMVQQRCPTWTDHNVSDPGVTLIETFAFMTDQLLYRLNRLPDRIYTKFLDLIGLRMLPPTPARVPVTFWLTTPAKTPLTIAAGSRVGTPRTETVGSVVFSTHEDLVVVPCALAQVRSRPHGTEESVDRTDRWHRGTPFPAFAEPPGIGDEFLVGLNAEVGRCAVRLEFDGRVDGLGVNPDRPPLEWAAWTGEEWVPCEVDKDGTGGLNRSGSVVLHVPPEHRFSVVDGVRAAWLRARIVEPDEGQAAYTASPAVLGLSACTVGATGDAINADVVTDETLGESEGVPGQLFELLSSPVLAGVGEPVVEVSSEDGWQSWSQVEHFAASGPTDRHFVLDAFAGEVLFGPAVRLPDGTMRQYGAIPRKGETIRIKQYAVGGGAVGNVGVGAIGTLRSSIPFVAAVWNRRSAHGGTEAETLEQAKNRGGLLLRTRSRAVTAEDYEVLSKEAVPEAARVRCITAGDADVAPGTVSVLVVPAAAVARERIRFEDLVPAPDMLARLAERLDQVRLVGTRVLVQPPRYRGVTVVARLVARPRVAAARVREDALDALYRFLSPLPGGGPDGGGWPFGRPVQSGDLYAVLQLVRGVEFVEDVRLFTANPVTGERGKETSRVELDANSLIFSFDHQIKVEEH